MRGTRVIFDARSAKIGGALNFTRELPPRLSNRLELLGVRLQVFSGPPHSVRERFDRRLSFVRSKVIINAGNRATVAPHSRKIVCVRDRLLLPDTGEQEVASIRSRVRRLLLVHALYVADAVVIPSESMREPVERVQRQLQRKSAPIYVIHHGRPTWSYVEPRAMRNPVRLLYPSHYEWHKNFPLLAGVLNLAKASRSPLHLTLTVSGTERLGDATLRDVFSSVASNVTFLGSVPPDALPALYESHDVLVFPSLVESFGLPLLEAMTSNMPIVASDRTWAREICQFAATYADPYSPQHWIDAITHVIKQTVRENKSGRIRALEFDWDKAADRYVELIEQLLH